jgi:hypothetical protein
LSNRRADAVRTGVTAADDDDVFAAREDLVGDRITGDDAVLLRQERHREVDAVEVTSRHRQVARPPGTAGNHERIVVGRDFARVDVLPT